MRNFKNESFVGFQKREIYTIMEFTQKNINWRVEGLFY